MFKNIALFLLLISPGISYAGVTHIEEESASIDGTAISPTTVSASTITSTGNGDRCLAAGTTFYVDCSAGLVKVGGVRGLEVSSGTVVVDGAGATIRVINHINFADSLDSTGLGENAGNANTGAGNTFVGSGAGVLNTTGANNVYVGVLAAQAVVSQDRNTVVGANAIQAVLTGGDNTVLGSRAMNAATGADSNVAIGEAVAFNLTTGDENVIIGEQAGYTANAANATTTGSGNTFVGYQSGQFSATQLTGSSAFGYKSLIGCSDCNGYGIGTTKHGFGTAMPTTKLHMSSGTLLVDGNGAGIKLNANGGVGASGQSFLDLTLAGLPSATLGIGASAAGVIFYNTPSGGNHDFGINNNSRFGVFDARVLVPSGIITDLRGDLGVNTITPTAQAEITSNKSPTTYALAVSSQTTVVASIFGVTGGGHVVSSGTIPSGTCNAGTIAMGADSNDMSGQFVAGAAAINCTLTFANAFAKKPRCWCNDESQIVVVRAVSTTTTIKCDVAIAFGGDTITYGCQAAP